jgi:aminoglycoside phosphotransferase (APT) family kinase protein
MRKATCLVVLNAESPMLLASAPDRGFARSCAADRAAGRRFERASGYLSRLMQTADRKLRRCRATDRRRAKFPPLAAATGHHRNFLDTGDRLLAVDWEYAGPGDPAADIACCIGYHELDSTQADLLLEAYGSETAILRERVEALG